MFHLASVFANRIIFVEDDPFPLVRGENMGTHLGWRQVVTPQLTFDDTRVEASTPRGTHHTIVL